MKRIFILVVIALFTVGALTAEEATLIDFSKLAADIYVDPGNPSSGDEDAQASEEQENNQNRQTMMDFSTVAGNNYTPEQKQVMKTSLAIPNWDVTLSSSSRNVTTMVLSFTKEIASKQWEKVMGVRIHFPVENFNGSARIIPPFEIPAYDWDTVGDDGAVSRPEGEDRSQPSRFEDGYGVIKNVGSLKAVAVNVYGLNFPHSLAAILIDSEGREKVIEMGSLKYEGWRELTWRNPQYISEVRNRELRLYPLYPTSTPFVKFGGFLIKRGAGEAGGDFIGYFKDVKIIYDKAVLDTERDINDEAEWRIIETREDAKKRFEVQRFGNNQVERYLETQKKATEDSFAETPKNSDQETQ
ncbi:MAG: flagellar filament outer layer protein FlaA [Treponema sp.]|jgi:hypothetical protein|nr:flagellar filament outer layer protein FlaA [Treponema sp.]